MLVRIVGSLRRRGPLGALRAARDVAIRMPRERRRRRSAKPTLHELVRATASIEVSAEKLLRQLGVDVPPHLSERADQVLAELQERTESRDLQFPERFAVEHESGRFLFLLVRMTRPRLMVETGVANGASTFLVLTAMRENEEGSLISFDVTSDVGSLLTEDERASQHWELRIIDPGTLPESIADLDGLDIFMHDSDHSYANVSSELETAWPRVRPGGLIIGDDGETSYAFLEASARAQILPYGLFDRRKLLMVVVR